MYFQTNVAHTYPTVYVFNPIQNIVLRSFFLTYVSNDELDNTILNISVWSNSRKLDKKGHSLFLYFPYIYYEWMNMNGNEWLLESRQIMPIRVYQYRIINVLQKALIVFIISLKRQGTYQIKSSINYISSRFIS